MTAAGAQAAHSSLVGREAELSAVRAAATRAASGSLQAVVLTGAAGIGKSRLLSESSRLPELRGFQVLAGSAAPLHRDISYAPLVEALQPLAQDAALVAGLSDLARIFPAIEVPPPVALGDADMERTRFFESVHQLLERAVRRHAVALVLDDAHWADPATLSMLSYLVRAMRNRRVLVLLAYRTEEANAPLRAVVTALKAIESRPVVPLHGLDPSEVRHMAEDLLQGSISNSLHQSLVQRTGGVPLFVKAVIEDLVEERGLVRSGQGWTLRTGAQASIPLEVTALLSDRIGALGAGPRALLDTLALTGDWEDEHVLRDVLAEPLSESVNTLVQAGLAVEGAHEGTLLYKVAHPMLGEVAHRLLPEVVRRQMHVRLSEAVARKHPEEVLRLAAHVRRAGQETEPALALRVLSAGAQAALDRRAGEEALENARAGLRVARELRDSEAASQLASAAALACEMADRSVDAHMAWLEAAAEADDERERARRLTRSADLAWSLGRFDEARRALDEAECLLAPLPPGEELVDVHGLRLRFADRARDRDEVASSLARLRGLGATSRSTRAQAMQLVGEAVLVVTDGRYDEAPRIADQLVALAQSDLPVLLAEKLVRPASVLRAGWGDIAGAREASRLGLTLARRAGVPALEIDHRSMLAAMDVTAGQWAAAFEESLADLVAPGDGDVNRSAAYLLATRVTVHCRRGEMGAAEAMVAQADRLFGQGWEKDAHIFAIVALAEGTAALAARDLDRALRLAGEAAASRHAWPYGMALLGEVHVARRDLEAARRTAGELRNRSAGAPLPSAFGAWLQGRAAGTPDKPGDVMVQLHSLDEAVELFERMDLPYEFAVAQLDRAEVGLAAGRAPVLDDVVAALAILEDLGARPQADRAKQILRLLGHRPAAPGRHRDERGLSRRESEVARLVAQGLSNTEVGERLFISPRTVTTHLQHIYDRLGLPSRAALIAHVLEEDRASAAGNT